MNKYPLVSILVCTYNRCDVLQRCLSSIFKQDFKDFELVIIDDCSTDNTEQVINSYTDERIRYIRNTTNVASVHGDRAHILRFVNELSRGQYFVYLCDDDYWVSESLLSRQVRYFQQYDNVAMVMGGQLSNYVNEANEGELFNVVEVQKVDYKKFKVEPLPEPPYYLANLYEKEVMTSDEFLTSFSEDPATKNIIVGATLYSKKHFIESGAMQNQARTKWQSGYEILIGPAILGKVVYIDEPSVVVEVRTENASFRGTQLFHYYDSISSIESAFAKQLKSPLTKKKLNFLHSIKKTLLKKVSYAFLGNTLHVSRFGSLTLCSQDNLDELVKGQHVLNIYLKNAIIPSYKEMKFMLQSYSPKFFPNSAPLR
jgi:glycosyltransferase involved in cell wall biosynthesis